MKIFCFIVKLTISKERMTKKFYPNEENKVLKTDRKKSHKDLNKNQKSNKGSRRAFLLEIVLLKPVSLLTV